jgi:glutamyl-tRNA synthetase
VSYRGRFAPSPTGLLHLGSAAAAIFAAAAASKKRGALVLRIDDIDTARVKSDAEAAFVRDLAWLGLSFDESPERGGAYGPYRQSERTIHYQAALDALIDGGHAYLCDCSRADIARASSAPHEGEEGPLYPGLCRPFGMASRAFRRPPAVRVRSTDGGDFVLRRGDGAFSYQLACAVDDCEMAITEVVRGADLASSATRQAWLATLLGHRPPVYTHVPLALAREGARLAKRDGGMTIAEQRDRGLDPRALVRAIAAAYGHPLDAGGDPLRQLAEKFDPRSFPGQPVTVDRIFGFLTGGAS